MPSGGHRLTIPVDLRTGLHSKSRCLKCASAPCAAGSCGAVVSPPLQTDTSSLCLFSCGSSYESSVFLTSFLVLALTESVEGFWYQYLGKYYLGCASWSYAAFAQWSTAWAAPVSCLSCWLLLGEPRRMEEPARWLEKGCIPFPPACSQ